MAQTTMLVRLFPLNKTNTTKDYTVLAGDKYPRTATYRESEGWYEVSTRIADLLDEEYIDGRKVFQVVTKQQGILLDHQAERALQRAEQRKATAANPHGQRRSAASFVEPARPKMSEYFADERDPDPYARPKAPASKPITPERRTSRPEPVEPVSDAGDADVLEGWLDNADSEMPHPADTIGDENDGDDGSDGDEPAAPEAAPAPEPEPKKGRGGKRPGK